MLKGIYKDVIKDFGTRTFNDIQSRANEIKAVGKFSVLTEDIENYIDDVSAEKVVLITETTKRDIKKIVQNAVQEGQSIPQMKKAIDGLYLDNIIPNRSRTIARTEVVSASNYGSYAGAKQTPSRLKKIWIPTFDDSTRESHLAMANHPPIGLDENFNVNGSYGQYPGDFSLPASEVINCRCAIGYEYVALPVQVPPRALEIQEVQSRQITVEELDNYEDLLIKIHSPNRFLGGTENVINKEFYKKLGYDGKPNVVNTEKLNEYIEKSDYYGYRGLPEAQYVEALKRGEYFSGTGIYGSGTYSAIVNKKILKQLGVLDNPNAIERVKEKRYEIALDYANNIRSGVSKFALSNTFKATSFLEIEKTAVDIMNKNFEKIEEVLKTLPTEKLLEVKEILDKAMMKHNKDVMLEYIKATRDIPNIRELDKAILNLHLQKDYGTLAMMLGYDGLYVDYDEYMVIFNRTKMIIDDETGKL